MMTFKKIAALIIHKYKIINQLLKILKRKMKMNFLHITIMIKYLLIINQIKIKTNQIKIQNEIYVNK